MVNAESTSTTQSPGVTTACDHNATSASSNGLLPAGITSDRRRPGRPGEVNPQLLPLLRGASTIQLHAHSVAVEADDMQEPPLLGVFSAIIVSSVLWFLAGIAGWLFFS